MAAGNGLVIFGGLLETASKSAANMLRSAAFWQALMCLRKGTLGTVCDVIIDDVSTIFSSNGYFRGVFLGKFPGLFTDSADRLWSCRAYKMRQSE